MKRKKFASKLCDYMENRIIEICSKFEKGNVNEASLPAFWMGLEADIESFLEENKLWIRKS
jgi:hypothetical protein